MNKKELEQEIERIYNKQERALDFIDETLKKHSEILDMTLISTLLKIKDILELG